jgi:hypothetical protein
VKYASGEGHASPQPGLELKVEHIAKTRVPILRVPSVNPKLDPPIIVLGLRVGGKGDRSAP